MSLLDIYDTKAPFVSMTPRRRARLDGVRITDVQWAPREARVVAIRGFLKKEEDVRLSVFDITTGAWRDIASVAIDAAMIGWAYVNQGGFRPVRWTE